LFFQLCRLLELINVSLHIISCFVKKYYKSILISLMFFSKLQCVFFIFWYCCFKISKDFDKNERKLLQLNQMFSQQGSWKTSCGKGRTVKRHTSRTILYSSFIFGHSLSIITTSLESNLISNNYSNSYKKLIIQTFDWLKVNRHFLCSRSVGVNSYI
jgi:hypothetical protein